MSGTRGWQTDKIMPDDVWCGLDPTTLDDRGGTPPPRRLGRRSRPFDAHVDNHLAREVCYDTGTRSLRTMS